MGIAAIKLVKPPLLCWPSISKASALSISDGQSLTHVLRMKQFLRSGELIVAGKPLAVVLAEILDAVQSTDPLKLHRFELDLLLLKNPRTLW